RSCRQHTQGLWRVQAAVRISPSGSGPQQAFEAQPLLRPEALTIVSRALLWQLVADAGRLHDRTEIGRSEQHIPHREKHGIVAATQGAAPPRFMADGDAMVNTVKAGANEHTLEPRPEAQAHISVRKALDHLGH